MQLYNRVFVYTCIKLRLGAFLRSCYPIQKVNIDVLD